VSELTLGSQALAQGAIDAGVSLVTSYPGGPATAIVDAILASTSANQVRVEWTSNEKVAVEMTLGASLGGTRALLCVKGVGLNVGLDPLMTMNLAGCNAGMVVLVGDDPGAWGSQNEQDSRVLALASELPLIEPTCVADARTAMRQAFDLSEELSLPVFVRVTRGLVLQEEKVPEAETVSVPPPPPFQRAYMRWVVLPVNVVPYHLRLHQRLGGVRQLFEASNLNRVEGCGSQGVIAAGFLYTKLLKLLDGVVPPGLRILRLGTFHPLPNALVAAFLGTLESVLVLEETAPLVENAVRAAAQQIEAGLPIYGRHTGHVPAEGELFGHHIAAALRSIQSGLDLHPDQEAERSMPSRRPFCDGCYYVPTFDALLQAMHNLGGRDRFIVVGDPGCMVLAQLPPYRLLDVKGSLGSSIGMAAGIALAQRSPALPQDPPSAGRLVVALTGDSSFLHSGMNGLLDAVRSGAKLLVLILDNGITALSGGQPHPGTPRGARGTPRQAVDLAVLARDAGAHTVQTVDLDLGQDLRLAIETGMACDGVAVVIARGQCRRWPALE
jgi:indolepyruvate ferredoxin oxidoreductase alpha subunit